MVEDLDTNFRAPSSLAFLAGGGEMGARMREKDWTQTPLGSPATWPQSLKTCVRIILTSRQPMFVWWGEALTNLYNDAYKAIVGGRHPEALGQPASVVWREIWDQVGPRAETTMRGDEGTYDEALLLIMERNGYPEETYYTFSYSPVADEHGAASGLICANTDDTRRVIGERQLSLLRDLAARTASAQTLGEACFACAASLASNGWDLPFALLYLMDTDRQGASLYAVVGIERGHPVALEHVRLAGSSDNDRHDESGDYGGSSGWPLAEVLQTQEARVVTLPDRPDRRLPTGAWSKPPAQAVMVPITSAGATGRSGVLVVGLNPFRLFDVDYRGFLGLVTGQISASIAHAQAYEDEKKRAEALAELDRVKMTFFSNVSHEFRTPLTLMLGPLEDALAAPTRALTGDNLDIAYRNALRLLKLVNSLLDFSRLEAGRMQASYEPTDLTVLTGNLASTFRSAFERAGLRFEVNCSPLPEPVFVDGDLWEKIVLNLLSNALKFTFEGAVRLTLAWCGNGVELSVQDTGTGIPESELAHLFERFHRVQGARSRTHDGSGIGLALASELVRLHGGTIRAESSQQDGKTGTTFFVFLPRGSAHLPLDRINAPRPPGTTKGATPYLQEALRWLPVDDGENPVPSAVLNASEGAPVTPPDRAAPGPAARVLLVDDNADMRDYVTGLLRARCWIVEAVEDGQAALQAVRRTKPDLILTDVMMPNLDGFGLLRALRNNEDTKHIPVIMLSARAGEESRVDGLEAGADDYLPKPFSARELLARVTTHVQLAQLRTTAEQANRAKDEFLSTLSHELRTPLNAILGWSQLLRNGSVPPDQRERALATVERNARVQVRLIEEMLDLARIEQGKLVLSVGPVEVVRVVEAALETVRPAAEAKGVQLQPVLDSHAMIVGDIDRLQQILWNLLANAIKFTPKGGRVQVRLRCEPSHVEVVVADSGQGIDADFLPHVFDRFRQADGTFARKAGGLGLGLTIVRSLVELHGGQVRAYSDGLNLGATFVVKLPTALLRLDQPASPAKGSSEMSHTSTFECLPILRGLRVLVVDDDPDTRELLRFVITQCETHVTTAESAAEALALLQQESFDVLVSDVGMPGEDGYALLNQVRALPAERGGQIPALALTAYARSHDRVQALKAGFTMHLAKPIDPSELLVVIATLVRGNRIP